MKKKAPDNSETSTQDIHRTVSFAFLLGHIACWIAVSAVFLRWKLKLSSLEETKLLPPFEQLGYGLLFLAVSEVLFVYYYRKVLAVSRLH